MRHDPTNIGRRLDLDPEKHQAGAVRLYDIERNPGEPQEAGRVRGGREGVDECRLDEVEIRLAAILPRRRRAVPMRRLPLHRRLTVRRMIVADAGSGVVVMM